MPPNVRTLAHMVGWQMTRQSPDVTHDVIEVVDGPDGPMAIVRTTVRLRGVASHVSADFDMSLEESTEPTKKSDLTPLR